LISIIISNISSLGLWLIVWAWFSNLFLFLLSVDVSIFLLVSALVVLLLFLIYLLKRLKGQKTENGKLKQENKVLQVENEKLLRERSDAEKVLRTTQVNLVKVSKSNKDKENLLQKIDKKITKFIDAKPSSSSRAFADLARMLKSQDDSEQVAFQIHMDELNQQFTDRLKANFPQLTLNDLRLCTYIKTGIATREIAKMTNVLPSSINVSRSRLRKKLELESKEDLYTFSFWIHGIMLCTYR